MKKYTAFLILLAIIISCSKNEAGSDSNGITPIGNPPPIENPVGNEANFTPCENGFAGVYPCNGYDLLGHISLSEMNATAANDIWGWTDTTTGKEYALIGLNNGTAFVDISDTEALQYLGKLPTATSASPWRDIKVHQDHAYIGSEAADHGMQVFDLTTLRGLSGAPITFSAVNRYTAFGNSHNIVINEVSGFAYAVGTGSDDIYSGGAHFIDIQDPKNPTAAGGYGASGYTHDAQVITYNGPDNDYSGREIFLGANEDRVVIVDVSDKGNPSEISSFQYNNVWYTHQGWFTADQRYFILGDELDEFRVGFNSRTLVFDLTDLDTPVLHATYLGPTAAIDHNGYVKGNEFFLANYTAGVRVLNISGIANGNISESGFFDSYPASNNTQFDGVWSVYPFLASGKILVSDINSGLFIIQKSN